MIFFQLDYKLHIQYDQMIQALLDGWTMGSVYVIRDNEMIFPLENGEVRAYSYAGNCMMKPNLSQAVQEQINQVKEDLEHLADIIEPDSLEEEFCRFLLLMIRRAYEVKPYADAHMTQVLLGKLNKRLEKKKIQIELDLEEMITPTFKIKGEVVSLEKAFMSISDAFAVTEVVTKSVIQYVQVPVQEETIVSAPVYVPEEAKTEAPAEIPTSAPVFALEETQEESDAPEVVEEEVLTARVNPFIIEEEVVEEPAVEEVEEVIEEPAIEEVEEIEEPAIEEVEEIDEVEEIPQEDFSLDEYMQGCGCLVTGSARELFENVLDGAKPDSSVFHSVCFSMGEIMYYRDELECARNFFEMCDVDFLSDQVDFYERLGHCYLDNLMGAFSETLKLLFRAEKSADYQEEHKEEIKSIKGISKEELIAYRKKCVTCGYKNYLQKHPDKVK